MPMRRSASGRNFFWFFCFLSSNFTSDFKQLMAIVEQKVVDEGRWSDVQSVDNAVAMFEAGKNSIVLPAKSNKGYTRRGASLAWTTVFKHLSEHRRSKKGAKSARSKRGREYVESESEMDMDEVGAEEAEEAEEAQDIPREHAQANVRPPPKKRHNSRT
jgi:hypothetical protein